MTLARRSFESTLDCSVERLPQFSPQVSIGVSV